MPIIKNADRSRDYPFIFEQIKDLLREELVVKEETEGEPFVMVEMGMGQMGGAIPALKNCVDEIKKEAKKPPHTLIRVLSAVIGRKTEAPPDIRNVVALGYDVRRENLMSCGGILKDIEKTSQFRWSLGMADVLTKKPKRKADLVIAKNLFTMVSESLLPPIGEVGGDAEDRRESENLINAGFMNYVNEMKLGGLLVTDVLPSHSEAARKHSNLKHTMMPVEIRNLELDTMKLEEYGLEAVGTFIGHENPLTVFRKVREVSW